MGTLSTYNVTAMGFWLPCGYANFFDPGIDQALIKSCKLADLDLKQDSNGQTKDIERLESSVSRRLVTVLHSKGYSHAFWLLAQSRQGYKDDTDPEAIVFLCQDQHPEGWPNGVTIEGLVLIMNDDGFYLWLAIYENTPEKDVEKALEKYIGEMMGADYFSHFSGKGQDAVNHFVTESEQEMPLTKYRDDHKGILNFFQLNVVLEGIYNSNFDPDVFFCEDFRSEQVRKTKEKYTLGSFAESIVAFVPLQQAVRQVAQNIKRLFECAEDNQKALDNRLDNPLAKQLFTMCLTEVARRDILRQFLRSTATGTLRVLKWYIERCRRALLSEMISITHRRQPLLQIESPDEGMDQITRANEAQIRGYVMLISAKLPLITNVQRYVKSVVADISNENIRDNLSAWHSSWNGLIDAIGDNIRGLERAIEQVQTDRLLYEEEQIRAEQETMAEIERIGERSATTLSETDNVTIGLVANLMTLLAISIAAAGLYIASPPSSSSLGAMLLDKISQFLSPIPLWVTIVGGIFIIVSLYILLATFFHFLIGQVIRLIKVLKYRWVRLGHRYHYHMDMRLDSDISEEKVQKLFKAHFGTAYGKATDRSASTPTGIYITAEGSGFQFAVPADTTLRTLKVYVGVWQAQAQFTASLSDNSASAYNDSPFINMSGATNVVYTLTYQAASSGQTLTITFTIQSGFGNVTLQAAALAEGGSGGAGGLLSGSYRILPPGEEINLTTEGTLDWAHWGLNTARSFNHKKTGGSKISNYIALGNGGVYRYADNVNRYIWCDGIWWKQFSKYDELKRRLPNFAEAERNSYRVERMSEDEALHKVYIEVDIFWPRKWLWWWPLTFRSSRRMSSFLTYELLFHRPSEAQSYILRELRFFATYDRILNLQQLEDLKRLILEKFINYWLEKNLRLNTDPTEEPLLGLVSVDGTS